jgi:hypothetical protein
MTRPGYDCEMKEPKLPRHDRIERGEAGDGWAAHVAVRGDRIVGLVVVPTDARQIPETFDPRSIRVAEARVRAVAQEQGIDPADAEKLLREAKLRRGGSRDNRQLYWFVARLVLLAQELGEPRYTYLRKHLARQDLGPNRDARIKDLISRATAAGYLAPAGTGRGPRKAGPNLERDTIRVRGGSMTVEPTGRVTIRDSEGKPVKGRKR